MKMNEIDLFGNLNINPISLEFEKGVTNTEWLLSIQTKVNEIVNFVNSMEEDTNSYTDSEVSKLKDFMNLQIDELKVLIELAEKNANMYSDGQNETLKKMIETRIITLEEEIEKAKNDITILVKRMDKIDETLIAGGVQVINPVTGIYSSIQEALNSIYNNIRVTMSWKEVNDLSLTWLQIENLEKTWFDFEFKIKETLGLNVNTLTLQTNV